MHRFRTGLRFNPMGIGTLGLVHATLHNKARLAVRGLLELAVRGDPAIAHGFAAARDALNLIDPKLPSAVLRCAFNGVIRPRIRYYDPQPDDEARRVYAVARAKRRQYGYLFSRRAMERVSTGCQRSLKHIRLGRPKRTGRP